MSTHSQNNGHNNVYQGAMPREAIVRESLVRPPAEFYPVPVASGYPVGYSPAYPAATAPSYGGTDFRRLFAMLRRRWKIILLTVLTVLAATAYFVMSKPAVFQRTATLQVLPANNSRSEASASDLDVLTSGITQSRTIETQLAILKSSPVQVGAFKRLSQGSKQALGKYVELGIEAVGDTDLISISVTSYSPQASAELANAICAEYIRLSREKNQGQLSSATETVGRLLRAAQSKLDTARTNLERYKRQTGTFDVASQSTAVLSRQAAIEAEWRQSRTDKLAAIAQVNQLRTQVSSLAPTITLPGAIVPAPASESAKARLTQLELERITKSQEYTSESPEIRALDAEIAQLRQRLSGAAQTQISSWTRTPNPIRENALAKIADLQGQIWALEARGSALSSASQQVEEQLRQLPGQEKRMGQMNAELATYQKNYDMLNDKYQSLEMTKGARVANASVLFPAQAGGGAVGQSRIRNLLLALFLGLGLAAALAAAVDWLDDRIYSEEEAQQIGQLPVLAQIPMLRSDEQRYLSQNALAAPSPLLESFRMLRTIISFAPQEKRLQVLTVTSSLAGEGKSTSCVNLAVAAALSGERVILVDCDLRRPSLHLLWGLSNEVGFSSVVNGTASLEEALQESGVPNLRILTSGPVAADPFILLHSPAARSLVTQMRAACDFVVLDTPPTLIFADAQIASSMSDGVLLVVSSHDAGKHEIARARHVLTQTGSNLIGMLLNKGSSESRVYPGRYYGSYQSDNASNQLQLQR
ncbi:MAG TPA: polysaccharide biosynthesis tyrosine autokinase [Abditibacteriaceae bacterium]|jgi:capsular exopolysaccharide synthesis family protein